MGIQHLVGEEEGEPAKEVERSSKEVGGEPHECGVLEAKESKHFKKHGWISYVEYCRGDAGETKIAHWDCIVEIVSDLHKTRLHGVGLGERKR